MHRFIIYFICAQVVDFGVAECKVLNYYKEVHCLEEVIGVDKNADLLDTYSFMIQPLTMDFLYQRESPLRMRLFAGGVEDYDSRLKGVEAVTMIEL